MNYLVIDLEMCKVPYYTDKKRYKYSREIIQIGAVLLDESYRQVFTFNEFVYPEYGVVDHSIFALTGIQSRQTAKAGRLKEVLNHLLDWLVGREYQVMTWSENDLSQLQHETDTKNIVSEEITEFLCKDRWIDYQKVFGERYGYNRAVSLEDALLLCDIDPDGSFHDGLCDALNTGKLIRKLELDPEYQLNYEARQKELVTEPLQSSIGNLLAGLNCQFA